MNEAETYEGFCAMWQRQRTMVWRMCLHHAPMGAMECADLVQEVAVALWNDYHNLEHGGGLKLERSWVWWHTRSVLSHLRRRQREERMAEGYDAADVKALTESENREALEEAMAVLGDEERRVVRMRTEGYDYAHIARAMGTTQAAAKQTMYRAKRAMQGKANDKKRK